MTGKYIGYHNKNFSAQADINIGVPESGFVIQFGRIGSWGDPPFETFSPVISFSGYSGYIFDQDQNMVGGYLKGQPISIDLDAFYGTGQVNRLSYKINNVLISNNTPVASGDVFIDSMLFEDYGGLNYLNLILKTETGSPTVLAGNTGLYILSSDGFYLAGA